MKKLLALFHRSLFVRLMSIFIGSVLLFFIIMSAGISWIYQSEVKDLNGFDFFEHHLNYVVDDFGFPPNINKAQELVDQLPIVIFIRDEQGNNLLSHEDIDLSKLKVRTVFSDHAQSVRVGRSRGIHINRKGYDYYFFGRRSFVDRHDATVTALIVGGVLMVLFVNYRLVRRLLRPIALLKEGAERISSGELHYRVKINQTDELGVLTNSINQMADSLNAMLEAKQQLLLGISHELRTPITRVKIQLAMMEPGAMLEEESKQSLLEDIDELDMLVSDLLEAERLNSQHAGLNREVVDVGQFTHGIIEQHWQGNVLLNFVTSKHIAAPESFSIDKLRYKLLVRNLVSNAIKYGESKPIEVKVHADLDKIILTISDSGLGIEEEHIKHITEPFYRADNARQRQTGGFGLGLYLCQLIVNAHNGQLEITSEIGKGTQVEVVLPITTDSTRQG